MAHASSGCFITVYYILIYYTHIVQYIYTYARSMFIRFVDHRIIYSRSEWGVLHPAYGCDEVFHQYTKACCLTLYLHVVANGCIIITKACFTALHFIISNFFLVHIHTYIFNRQPYIGGLLFTNICLILQYYYFQLFWVKKKNKIKGEIKLFFLALI